MTKRNNKFETPLKMELFIFKTNVTCPCQLKTVNNMFSANQFIGNWSVDTYDVDNVMRVELADGLASSTVVNLMESAGLQCEMLPD